MRTPEQIVEFLVRLEAHRIPHDIADLLTHFTGVHYWLRKLGAPEHVQTAGLLHTIYGAEAYPGLVFPVVRDDIRKLVGIDTENLIHRYCSLTTASAEATVILGDRRWLWDRWADKPLVLADEEYEALLWLLFANSLDKDYRLRAFDAQRFRASTALTGSLWKVVARQLGELAQRGWEDVYGESIASAEDGRLSEETE